MKGVLLLKKKKKNNFKLIILKYIVHLNNRLFLNDYLVYF